MGISIDEFSRVVAAIHDASSAPHGWSVATQGLVRLFNASKGAIFDMKSGAVSDLTTIGHDPDAQREYLAHFYAIDPTMAWGMSVAPHSVETVYDLFPADLRSKSEYFQFAKRVDIGDVVATRTFGVDNRHSVVSFQHSYGGVRFGDDEKKLLQLLLPHLEIAKRVAITLADAEAARQTVAAGLDRFAHAAFIVDADAHVLHLNAAGQALLRTDARVRVKGGALGFSDPALKSAFDTALRGCAREGGRGSVLPMKQAGQEITLSPLGARHALAGDWQRPLALVVVGAPRNEPHAIALRMRALYGLTGAEANLASLIAIGHTVEEIALAKQVEESTLRAQLKSIFAKTGARRQAELVRLALAGPAVLDT